MTYALGAQRTNDKEPYSAVLYYFTIRKPTCFLFAKKLALDLARLGIWKLKWKMEKRYRMILGFLFPDHLAVFSCCISMIIIFGIFGLSRSNAELDKCVQRHFTDGALIAHLKYDSINMILCAYISLSGSAGNCNLWCWEMIHFACAHSLLSVSASVSSRTDGLAVVYHLWFLNPPPFTRKVMTVALASSVAGIAFSCSQITDIVSYEVCEISRYHIMSLY